MVYSLLVLDLVLLGIIFFLLRNRGSQVDVLAEVTEERRMISELKEHLFERMDSNEKSVKRYSADIQRIASEVSEEAAESKKQFRESLERACDELGRELDGPLVDLARKQAATEVLLRKLDQESRLLGNAMKKAAEVKSFLEAAVPYQEILEDLETRKYVEAKDRLLLGESIKDVGDSMNLSQSERHLVVNLLNKSQSSARQKSAMSL